MILDCYAICAPGRVRLNNQDNLYVNGLFRDDIADNSVFQCGDEVSNNGLFAVVDGMGGEKHGELAAFVAVTELSSMSPSGGGQSMVEYLIERNAVICDLIEEKGGERIGSTFAGLSISGMSADIVNIGDSRVYHLTKDVFTQISRDHTSISQMIDLGVLTREAARTHPGRHKLSQHLGIFPYEMLIEPYAAQISIQENDMFLLCSDGLTDMLDDSAIESVLKSTETIRQKAESLYEAALENGGKDNITILIVQAKKEVGGLFG